MRVPLVLAFVVGSLFGLDCQHLAEAAAPMARTQAPGFYRIMLGDFEITALNDGVVETTSVFPGTTKQEIAARQADNYQADPFKMSFNAFLVNTGERLVLIDTGAGELADTLGWPGAGHLLTNLKAAGYRPEQIDEIYITHCHPDHIAGLVRGSQRTFPNALVRIAQSEAEPYLSPQMKAATIAHAPDQGLAQRRIERVASLLEPYVIAGKLESFAGDIDLAPGIRALATHGHTPGHTSYLIESKGQTMIVIGDLIHEAPLQFPSPWIRAASEADPDAAIAQRIRIFGMAADRGYWVAGAHLSFPGIGHIRHEGAGFRWVPANYEIPK